MPLIISCILSAVLLMFGCNSDPDKFCSDIVYNNKIFSYVELREGMRIRVSSLLKAEFVANEFYRFSIGFASFDKNCRSQLLIDNLDTLRDYIPGRIGWGWSTSFPLYDTVHNQTRYNAIAKEFGDEAYNRKFCEPIGLRFDAAGMGVFLHLAVLYNQLDSMKLVCVSHAIGKHPINTSLNDIVSVALRPALPVSVEFPSPFLCELDSFYSYSRKKGITRGWAVFEPYSKTSCPTTKLGFEGIGFDLKLKQLQDDLGNPYKFKLYFYLDDGKLTVESNEFALVTK